MIAIGQGYYRRVVLGKGVADLIYGHVEVKEQGALHVILHHALRPEKGRKARATRHRGDM